MTDTGFRHDINNFQWTVGRIKEMLSDMTFGRPPTKYFKLVGKVRLPTIGPSERAIRAAGELIEQHELGRHEVDANLVVTVEGLADDDSVHILEGPGAAEHSRK